MPLYFKAMFLYLLLISGAGRVLAYDGPPHVELNVRDYGAIPNDKQDDAPALIRIFEKIQSKPGEYTIVFPKGVFDFWKQIDARNLSGEIVIKGQKGTTIKVHGPGFAFLQASSRSIEIISKVNRNESEVYIKSDNIDEIEKGDIVHVSSSSEFETGWKYKENDVHRIKGIDGNKVELASPLLFNYDPAKEKITANVFSKCKLSFQQLEWILDPAENKDKPARFTVMTVRGVQLSMRDIRLRYHGKMDYYHVGVSVLASEDLEFSNIYMRGLMYGILMNYCRNVEAKNTEADSCRHAYAPTQACYNVYVEKLKGLNCHSVLDAHQSFNVHYKNVLDTLATQLPNCRSLGTHIEDARIYVSKNAKQDYAYWSVQLLTKEYQDIYKEVETRFENVHYVVAKPTAFNGLTSYTCRKLIIKNCTTSSIAYYGDQKVLEQVSITDSKAGVIRIDGQKTEIKNTELDGRLFPNASYVLRFTGSGKTVISKVSISNYNPDKTYLFDHFYNLESANAVTISDSRIGKLKGFTNKMIYPGKEYKNVEVNTTEIDEFSEELPAELGKVSKKLAPKAKSRKD